MMTVEAAYMPHCETELRTLEAGKLAALIVLSAGPLLTAAERLTGIDVLLTMIDGTIEWRETAF